MTRLSIRQLVFAIAMGALFAALQGEAPVKALASLSRMSPAAICTAPLHC
jgi:hypothetical protein